VIPPIHRRPVPVECAAPPPPARCRTSGPDGPAPTPRIRTFLPTGPRRTWLAHRHPPTLAAGASGVEEEMAELLGETGHVDESDGPEDQEA